MLQEKLSIHIKSNVNMFILLTSHMTRITQAMMGMKVRNMGVLFDQLYSRPSFWPPERREYWNFSWLWLHLRNVIFGSLVPLIIIYWSSREDSDGIQALVRSVCDSSLCFLLINTLSGSLLRHKNVTERLLRVLAAGALLLIWHLIVYCL